MAENRQYTQEQIDNAYNHVSQYGMQGMNDDQIATYNDMSAQGLFPRFAEDVPDADTLNFLSSEVGAAGDLAATMIAGGNFGDRSPTGDVIRGGLETVWNAGVAPMAAAAGTAVNAVVGTPYRMLRGDTFGEAFKALSDDMGSMFGHLTFAPRTVTGAVALGVINNAFAMYDTATDKVATVAAETLADPLLYDGAEELGLTNEQYATQLGQLRETQNTITEMLDNNETPPAELMNMFNEQREALGPIGMPRQGFAYPAFYHTIKTLLDFGPDIAFTGGQVAMRNRAIANANKQLREMGFDPEDISVDRLQKLATKGNEVIDGLTGEQRVRGQDLGGFQIKGEALSPDNLQKSILEAQEAEREMAGAMYAEARESDAWVSTDQFTLLNGFLGNHPDVKWNRFDIDTATLTRKYLDELSQMGKKPDIEFAQGRNTGETRPTGTGDVFEPFTDVDQIWALRQRINKAIENYEVTKSGKNVTPEHLNDLEGLKWLRRGYDQWIDTAFKSDLMGDPANLAKWRNANNFYAEYFAKFEGDAFMRQFLETPKTNEEIRRLIFGLTDSGFKPEAARSVRQLANLFGEDSPQMDFLRNDIAFSLFEPITRPANTQANNLAVYQNRYDQYFRRDATLMKELFDAGQIEKFELFNRIVEADFETMRLNPNMASRSTLVQEGAKERGQMQTLINNAGALVFAKNVPGGGQTGLMQASIVANTGRTLMDKLTNFKRSGMNDHQQFMASYLNLDPRLSVSTLTNIKSLNPIPQPGNISLRREASEALAGKDLEDINIQALRNIAEALEGAAADDTPQEEIPRSNPLRSPGLYMGLID